ncbi:MAG TPA: CaiB/BaiF CoA-transferase family protein, partial [Cyclobacteriaceae bacterium]|nr:CaiB/BaiF CoA-transferase family protein [Cyclobacteriaceae bacterium]
MQSKAFFDGLFVTELASVLAGPSVGQFFAELGATVIKVENLKTGGDVTRSWKLPSEPESDLSAYFCSANWGKHSISVDLTKPEAKIIMEALFKKSDIVISSYKAGDANKLGVDYEAAKAINPKIIYGEISGYGPDNTRVGYDAEIQAEAGFMFMNGEPESKPTKMPVALIDLLAAHQLKEGLLLALLKKERTGEGSCVQVSLIDAALASLANQAMNWLMAGKIPQRQGSAHPNIAPYGDVYESKDGKQILLAIGNDKQFQQFCVLIGEPALAKAPEFLNNQERVKHRVQLGAAISKALKEINSEALLPQLHAAKIPAGLVQNMQEVFAMPEAKQLVFEHLNEIK